MNEWMQTNYSFVLPCVFIYITTLTILSIYHHHHLPGIHFDFIHYIFHRRSFFIYVFVRYFVYCSSAHHIFPVFVHPAHIILRHRHHHHNPIRALWMRILPASSNVFVSAVKSSALYTHTYRLYLMNLRIFYEFLSSTWWIARSRSWSSLLFSSGPELRRPFYSVYVLASQHTLLCASRHHL